MSDQDQDKTEQATPYRLEEARKKGEVAKSMDLSSALVMIVSAAIVALTAPAIAMAIAGMTKRMIAVASSSPAVDGAFVARSLLSSSSLWQALAPLAIGLPVIAVAANLAQTGPMFTTHPLRPDFSRLSPATAIKRIFSMKSLWELGKILVKLSVLAAICAAFLWNLQAVTDSIASAHPKKLGAVLLDMFKTASIYVLIVIAAAAVVDLLFVRRDFKRRMKMSRRELKDEIKRRDGDQAVKAKRKQQVQELLRKIKALASVKDADVVVTNPTHFAVALRYRVGETMAPVVTAKGAGALSAQIRKIAAKSGVPIIRSPVLARALYKGCGIDAMVPADLYIALAPIYRRIWAMRDER
ncbi:EscU/YscU/HrcU family type III secretion system export apparatus switch protein [Arenimonas terrae]|uniref:Flagellar biosynthetic protein FlhB n=1 Tax=Arenimonas terrae TaxID=2546226 RepID=A0A5C4RQL8_9GAMM|nr:EscU/YscU/HrcU family type III secretion system export apparatus switch protein [Arenimonas terrae]TNJ33245.1 EscU/YscU/HrcU family type III secretion system export apparatus switch protein [Arenimonas terrae]